MGDGPVNPELKTPKPVDKTARILSEGAKKVAGKSRLAPHIDRISQGLASQFHKGEAPAEKED